MSSIAEIVAEELEAARRRIAERIAALMAGPAPAAPSLARPRPAGRVVAPLDAPARCQGRVRVRLTPAQVAEERRRVLAAVTGGAARAGDIIAATGLDRHRVTYAANQLRDEGKLRRRGKGRAATYYVPA
ncbi:MAG: hypothetical protein NVSMB47_21680 [Polyangiales bacterium]